MKPTTLERLALAVLAVGLALTAAFFLWVTTHFEAEYLDLGVKIGLLPAGITLAVLATLAGLAALLWRG